MTQVALYWPVWPLLSEKTLATPPLAKKRNHLFLDIYQPQLEKEPMSFFLSAAVKAKTHSAPQEACAFTHGPSASCKGNDDTITSKREAIARPGRAFPNAIAYALESRRTC